MNIENISTLVALLVALSVASERLVDIIKGVVPFLNRENLDAKKEGWRRSSLQTLAVVSGIVTTLLTQHTIKGIVGGPWDSPAGILALGLLASGGSGFWNAVLKYVAGLKDLQNQLVAEKRRPKP